ncbi:MAG: hypothetical protein R2708_03595 [Vicinamibacterales bacterium]
MQRALIASLVTLLTAPAFGQTTTGRPAEDTSAAVFRAGIDLVTVSATAKRQARAAVADLTAEDFEVLDRGVRRPITEFRRKPRP